MLLDRIFLGGVAEVVGPGISTSWVSEYGAPSENSDAWGMAVASDSSIYVAGVKGTYPIAMRIGGQGQIMWQRTLSEVGRFSAVVLDASGDVYFCGQTDTSPRQHIIVKYSASGTLQWQRKISYTGGALNLNEWRDAVLASDGNMWVTGPTSYNGGKQLLAKFSPSGSVGPIVTAGGSVFSESTAIGVAPSRIIIAGGATGATTRSSLIVCDSGLLATTYLRKLDGSGTYRDVQGMVIDSSSNIFTIDDSCNIVKQSIGGGIAWTRWYTRTGSNAVGVCAAMYADVPYFGIRYIGSPNDEIFVVSLSTTGTLSTQHRIINSGTFIPRKIFVDATYIYILCQVTVSGFTRIAVLKLTKAAMPTGDHGGYNFAVAGNATTNKIGSSWTDSDATVGSDGMSMATYTVTDAAGSIVPYLKKEF